MLKQTNHVKAPWHIIRSNDKHKARLETMKLILNQVDYDGRCRALEFAPDPKTVFSAEEELAVMAKQQLKKRGPK
jgi:hypothetical protein